MASSSNTARVRAGASSPGALASSRANAVIATTGAVIGALAVSFGPFISLRPNRVVSGETASALASFGTWGWALLGIWLAVAVLARASAGRNGEPRSTVPLARGLLGTAALGIVLARTGVAAAEFAASSGPAARTSFGWSFYLMLFALFLTQYAASADAVGGVARALLAWSLPATLLALAASGILAELGIVREWMLARDTFVRALGEHLSYALGATGIAVVVGIPLGVLSARSKAAEGPIMGTLNLGQVFPALAFVGIMMPVLGGLSDRVPLLAAAGVAGIGWAPVLIVLVIYALFPVVRNTLVAIRQLDPAVLDSAKGMGMSRWRSLAEIELPLAFPIVLAGVRIALVQSTAGAVLAAFVGGGGLGTIMFFGLEQTSMDLVLVGVLPIVAFALLFDALLRAIERAAGGEGADVA